jgi:glycosyltransferase
MDRSVTKISLITASYNSSATIADTLRSIAEQSHGDVEHIVIDGGSRDHTMQMVERQGVHVVQAISEPDRGIYDAYNKGIAMATGDIVGLLNSDDYYRHALVLSKVAEVMEDPSIDGVCADLIYVSAKDTTKVKRVWRGAPITRKGLMRGFHPAHPTLFLRREVYDRVGNFRLDLGQSADVEFMFRLLFKHKAAVRHVRDIWVVMRNGGATGGGWFDIVDQNRSVLKGREENGISYPVPLFVAHKLIDRAKQRVRGFMFGANNP